MEFLLYLSPDGRDIYNLISQTVRVVENTPICRKYDIYGWYDANTKTMIFCTDRIKSGPNPQNYINETLFHESVHVAQSCKNKMTGIFPLGISLQLMPLSDRRKADLGKTIKEYNNSHLRVEHEAFWMEDKPDKVKYVLQKYCF
jgi:hypothetical protein